VPTKEFKLRGGQPGGGARRIPQRRRKDGAPGTARWRFDSAAKWRRWTILGAGRQSWRRGQPGRRRSRTNAACACWNHLPWSLAASRSA